MADVTAKTVPGGNPRRVLMTLDGVRRDPEVPLVFADDQAVLRGDGVFETILVRGGEAQKLPAHLERLARSAAILELPEPDLDAWARAATAAAAAWGETAGGDGAAGDGAAGDGTAGDGAGEGVLRLVLSRGRESVDAPTAYLSVSELPARTLKVREQGVSAVTLERGYSTELAASSSWLPLGAKTLSYAVNMAAVRHAEKLGADDVIFVSAEGQVLEGPRSTVVIARGRTLLTPPPELGILPGTTQRALFDEARRRGFDCVYATLRPADLIAADGVWMLSSITLVATVNTINGFELADPGQTLVQQALDRKALDRPALDAQVKAMLRMSV